MVLDMASDLKSLICTTIDSRASDLNDISQSIWNNPELQFEEYHAHEVLTSFLVKEGFTVQKKTPLETSFLARYGEAGSLKVGLICEYDALPGIGHACGHNLIAEAGIAAALGVKAVLSSRKDLKAELILFGTPAEEGGGGKLMMIEKGSFDGVDICLMSHPKPFEIPMPICLSVSGIILTFHGKPSHASAAPWDGINALDAAVSCYNAISMLRQQIKPTSRLHCIISDGGQKPNIIPERSEINMYVRGVTDEDVADLVEKVKNCAQFAAVATCCTVDITKGTSYSAMKTNNTLINLYVKNAEALGVPFNDNHIRKEGGSTDMGDVSQIIPSIHPLFKIKTEAMNHTREFTDATGNKDNQEPTLNSAKSMAMTVIDVICNRDLMMDVLCDFQKPSH